MAIDARVVARRMGLLPTSRSPAAISLRTGSRSVFSGGGGSLTRIEPSSTAETTKLTASTRIAIGAVRIWTRKPAEPKARNSETELDAARAPFARTRSGRGTMVGRNALSAASKKVVSTAVSSVTTQQQRQRQPATERGQRDEPQQQSTAKIGADEHRTSPQPVDPRARDQADGQPGDEIHAAHERHADRVGVERDDGHEGQRDARDERAEDGDRGRAPDTLKRAVTP